MLGNKLFNLFSLLTSRKHSFVYGKNASLDFIFKKGAIILLADTNVTRLVSVLVKFLMIVAVKRVVNLETVSESVNKDADCQNIICFVDTGSGSFIFLSHIFNTLRTKVLF